MGIFWHVTKYKMQLSEIKPQFVLVIGGAGSGKNYYIEHSALSSFQLVDVDAIKGKLGVSAAISAIKPMLLQAFLNRENVVHPTTASNLQAQKNKIAAAKEHGYSVMLLLVERPVEQALDQVRQRVAKGGHDVNIDKIVSSNAIAKSNFTLLAPLVDVAKTVS